MDIGGVLFYGITDNTLDKPDNKRMFAGTLCAENGRYIKRGDKTGQIRCYAAGGAPLRTPAAEKPVPVFLPSETGH